MPLVVKLVLGSGHQSYKKSNMEDTLFLPTRDMLAHSIKILEHFSEFMRFAKAHLSINMFHIKRNLNVIFLQTTALTY